MENNSLDYFLEENNNLKKQIKSLQEQKEKNLSIVLKNVEQIFETYKIFLISNEKDINNFKLSFPMISGCDVGRIGNHSLIDLTLDDRGFVILHTKDVFRGEVDCCEALLPQKYFAQNGLELLMEDIENIKGLIEMKKLEKEIHKKETTLKKNLVV